MKMRDYQELSVKGIQQQFIDHDSTLLVLPTGCGKTVVFAELIRRISPTRVMVLAHRSELIYQAKAKIEQISGAVVEIEMADQVSGNHMFTPARVIVSSVQTQQSGPKGKERMLRFNPMDFGLVIVDEAHHSAAKGYRKILDHYKKNPNLKVLGVTATPDRTDELALGEIFKSVAYDYEIINAIHDGYLVPIDQQFVIVHGMDFSNVKTTAGDLNKSDLAAVMENEKNMQGVAAASLQIIGDKRTLVFTASVKQAETLANIFNRSREGMADWVCGETDKQARIQKLKDFESGRTQVICNCGVLTEGYDNPAVEIVIMARPTKSRSLYAQMAGRGTRSLTGLIDGLETAEERKAAIAASSKPSLLIVDFVGNSGRHKLMTAADILGGKSSEEAIELAIVKAQERGGRVSISKVLDESEEELRMNRIMEAESKRLEEEARKARLLAQVQFSRKSVDPFNRFGVECRPANDWDKRNGRIFSEKQRAVLKNIGANPDAISFASGKQLIGAYFNRDCSPAQARVLARAGYAIDGVSSRDASKLIDALAANNWVRPPDQPTLPKL